MNLSDTIISAARVFISADKPVIADGAIVVRGDRIYAAGPRDEIRRAHSRCEEWHFPSSTLLPGLIDCHEHLVGNGFFAIGTGDEHEPDTMFAFVFADSCAKTLRKGVTTVRVPGTRAGVDVIAKRASARGLLTAPRLWCAGQAITMTGGHGKGVGVQADGADACMRAARGQLAAGADFLKVMASGGVGVVRDGEDPTHPEMQVDEIRAVVTVANAARRRVAAHADGVEGISNSLEAGVHTVEHGIFLTPEHAKYMAKNGVALVPTLSTMTAIAFKTEELGLEPNWKPIAESVLETHRQSFTAALHAGVIYATGTDSFGDIVEEMIEMTSYGVSNTDVIRAATESGAAVIGIPQLGTLEAGSLADLIAVPGDPTNDLEVLRTPELVMVAGREMYADASARG